LGSQWYVALHNSLNLSCHRWRAHRDQFEYVEPLRWASGTAQHDAVHAALAQAAHTTSSFSTAALHWARVVGSMPLFDDMALSLSPPATGIP
jgi:hypothetical protein